MTGIPQQCAELRADFIEKGAAPMHVAFANAMVASSLRQGDDLFPPDWSGAQVAHDMVRQMRLAEMWSATPEMFDLIHHASKSMPPQVLMREDLPSPVGFLYLPVPLSIQDIRGERLRVHGVLWSERELGHPGKSPGWRMPDIARGIVIHMFTRMFDRDDPLLRVMPAKERGHVIANSPILSLYHCMSVAFGQKTWDVDTSGHSGTPQEKADDARRVMGSRKMRSLHDGEVIEVADDGAWLIRTESGDVLKAVADPTVQFLSAYFHFVKSELTTLDRERTPKASAKFFRRLGMPDSPVTVVRLRRHAHSDETGRGTPLSYRYVRRGFWRQQWYGSVARGDRHQRSIWINPTLVGPDDGPLRIRDVVNLVQQ